jgi:hypothetical protein
LEKLPSIQVLHHNEALVVIFEDFVNFDDVRVIQLGKDLEFVLKANVIFDSGFREDFDSSSLSG